MSPNTLCMLCSNKASSHLEWNRSNFFWVIKWYKYSYIFV